MKKSSKAWLLIAVVMMLVGVGFASVGTAMGGRWSMIFDLESFKIISGNKNMISDKVSVDKNFKKIYVQTGTIDVNIKKGNEFIIEYKTPEYLKPEITTVGNTLSIVTNKKKMFTLFNFNFGKDEQSYINITLTEDMYEDAMEFEFETDTGDLLVDGVNINGQVETSTGDVDLKNLTSTGIKIDGSTSDVTITNCTINGSLKTSLSTGDVIISNSVISEIYESETSTGDIKISDSKITWFKMGGSTSDLTVRTSEMDRVEIETSTGDIRLELDICGREIDGKNYESPAAEKKIDIQTSTGDIEIDLR